MNNDNNRLVIVCITMILVIGSFAALSMYTENKAEAAEQTSTEFVLPTYPWQNYGYTSIYDYSNSLVAKQDEVRGASDEAAEMYADVITEDQLKMLRVYENEMLEAQTFRKYNNNLDKFNEIIDALNTALEEYLEKQAVAPSVSYGENYSSGSNYANNGNGLTKSGGVNWYNGRKETWYSSNVLWHYRTNEWTLGSDGVYRDADGYIIVAASDTPYGSIVDTSLGKGKVYDSGCGSNIYDIYVGWQ